MRHGAHCSSVRKLDGAFDLAALWLARAGQKALIEDPGLLAGRLAKLPVACTSWDGLRLSTLRTMGVGRIGELMRLPRAGIARRFGPAAVLDLDIALARQSAPRRAFAARERFRERCDFETEVETVVYLQRRSTRSSDAAPNFCGSGRRGAGSGAQAQASCRACHPGSPGIGERHRRPQTLDGCLDAKAGATRARRADPLHGASVRPAAAALGRFSRRVRLPGGVGGRDTAPQLVERLRARLGEQAVYGFVPCPSNRPEAAWQRVNALQSAPRRPLVGGPMFPRCRGPCGC